MKYLSYLPIFFLIVGVSAVEWKGQYLRRPFVDQCMEFNFDCERCVQLEGCTFYTFHLPLEKTVCFPSFQTLPSQNLADKGYRDEESCREIKSTFSPPPFESPKIMVDENQNNQKPILEITLGVLVTVNVIIIAFIERSCRRRRAENLQGAIPLAKL